MCFCRKHVFTAETHFTAETPLFPTADLWQPATIDPTTMHQISELQKLKTTPAAVRAKILLEKEDTNTKIQTA